jgi:hypothetical protein
MRGGGISCVTGKELILKNYLRQALRMVNYTSAVNAYFPLYLIVFVHRWNSGVTCLSHDFKTCNF